jgi:uncharacterized repeat protein (TIGR01451 family)
MNRTIDRLSALFSFRVARWLSAALLLASGATVSAQCVSLTTLGSASTQSFNTLSNTAGSTTNNLTITGWFMTETGGGARDNEQYAVDTGGSNTGDTFSYGPAGNTDRALGGLQSGTLIPVIGACFTNNTGSTISSLDVAYTGEQWRIGNTAAAREDRLDYQYSLNATSLTTGTWVDVNGLDFVNPIQTAGTAGALDGNAAANRTAISQSITSLSIANGATFWIRWNDFNGSGTDDGLAVDDFSLTPQGGAPPVPALNISDVSLAEGDPPGTTTFTFAVTLTAPAGAGGVTFDIATADGTAQDDNPSTEDNDYVAQNLTGQSIPMGSTGPYNFNVTVNRDTTTEANETFFVNVTNVVGANVGDGQGLGTINNDDVSLVPIHDIQGPGNSSPIVGSTVTTRGIVTGVRSNGFFIQESDALVDADPATSEGILVFTSAAPPAAAVVGNLVQVTGTVLEFVPVQDPLQPPLTELSSPTVVQISTGNPLPIAIPLTATFPDPSGPVDQLERLEGMRVSIASLTASSPTLGLTVNEPNATQASNGVFFGTVTGVPRPAREAGIQAPDPAPSGGTIPPIPRFDANPEVIRVDSDGLVGGGLVNLDSGAVVAGLIGPLDYTFRRYTVLPDPGATISVTGGITPTSVSIPSAREFTVASYNVERFYDTVDDPAIGEPVLTAGAFDIRLAKASIGIRNHLRFPDVIGMVEIENLAMLQAIATRVNSDAIANSQPDPSYQAFLVEGNDVGGIDVGFLVKTAPVVGATARVTVNAVVQENAGELFVNPDSSTSLLNDRPPLRLDAVINAANGSSFPVQVIVVHQRSLLDINVEGPGTNGWPTSAARIRAKRQEQAESLANLVQARQTTNPAERIILVGDFNAFEFNDGMADVMNVLAGTPAADNQTAVPGDGADLVNPDLDNLVDTPPAGERYSYVFDGQTQNIDHAIVNATLIADTSARRLEHPRINTDFRAVDRNDPNTARHLSDHDPLVAYFEVEGFAAADVSITKTDHADPVTAGEDLVYSIVVANTGPDPAQDVAWTDTLPPGTSFVSLTTVGWSCTTPAVGAGGTVSCSTPTLPVGGAVFTMIVAVDAAIADGTVLSNTANVTTTTADPNGANDSATETTTVTTSADVSVVVTDTPDPVAPAANLTYAITVANAGPSAAANAAFSNTMPAGTSFVSLTVPAGWSCATPPVGAIGDIDCSIGVLGAGDSANFTLVVAVDGATVPGSTITNTVETSSATNDPNLGNDSATVITTVGAGSADLAVTITDAPDPVAPATNLTYTITASNLGPASASTAALGANLPATVTFVSLNTPAGWSCTTPAVGATGAIACSNATFGVGSAVFTLVGAVDAGASGVVNADASISSATIDPDGSNNAASTTTTIDIGVADVSVTKTAPASVAPGAALSYSITVANAGPASAANVVLADALPANTTFASLSVAAGWNCTTPAVGSGGSVNCTQASLAAGSSSFVLVVDVAPGATGGSTIANTATVSTTSNDPASGNNSATANTTVIAPAAIRGSKSVSGSRVPGGALTYTIVLTNSGGTTQADNPGDEFVDVLPASLTLVTASATSGTAVANIGTNTVTWNGSVPAGASVTITIQATIQSNATVGSTILNQGTIGFDADANGTNEASALTDDPATAASADGTGFVVVAGTVTLVSPTIVPATTTWTNLLIAALMMMLALVAMRRRVS